MYSVRTLPFMHRTCMVCSREFSEPMEMPTFGQCRDTTLHYLGESPITKSRAINNSGNYTNKITNYMFIGPITSIAPEGKPRLAVKYVHLPEGEVTIV